MTDKSQTQNIKKFKTPLPNDQVLRHFYFYFCGHVSATRGLALISFGLIFKV